MTDHIVKSFDSELIRLDGEIQRMGELAISQLDAAIDVLQRRDNAAAMRVVANDEAIDALEHEVSHDVLRLLALRQPMDAYRTRDADRAMVVRGRDAEVDAEYTGLFRELLTYMAEDPRQITACTHLLFIAKNIERIGDHATNIAENTWFLVHGEQPAGEREKRDTTAQ